jgi:hypothetical protein
MELDGLRWELSGFYSTIGAPSIAQEANDPEAELPHGRICRLLTSLVPCPEASSGLFFSLLADGVA